MTDVAAAAAAAHTCAVIVTYFPDESFGANLTAIASQVGAVHIVDNGSTGDSLARIGQAARLVGATVCEQGRNLGIATALNQGVRWASEAGFEFVVTFDQDSQCAPSLVASLLSVYYASERRATVAMVGTRFVAPDSATRDVALTPCESAVEVPHVITSGTLLPLSVYRLLGPFADELFIDWVDVEYCLRARKKGFRVLQSQEPLMVHAIGAESIHSVGTGRVGTSNHSALRRYYRHRNFMRVARAYFQTEPWWITHAAIDVAKGLVLLALFEEQRRPKLRLALLGLVDGVRGAMHRSPSHYGGRTGELG